MEGARAVGQGVDFKQSPTIAVAKPEATDRTNSESSGGADNSQVIPKQCVRRRRQG